MSSSALVIAINEYPAVSRLRPLAGAVSDAVDFADWALHENGGDVDPGNLYFWTYPAPGNVPERLAQASGTERAWPTDIRPDFNRAPDAAAIKRAARAAAETAVREEIGRLFIFFAGHGVQVVVPGYREDPQNCFVAADYIPNESEGLVPLDDLRRMCVHLGPSQALLFFDCCRNQLLPTASRPQLLLGDYIAEAAGEKAWLAATAARSGALAYETPLHSPNRGAFTKMFVQGLRQFRRDDRLTLDQLKGFVRSGVGELVKPNQQVPQFYVSDDQHPFELAEGGPIGSLPSLVVTFGSNEGPDIDIKDDRAVIVASLARSNAPQSLPLPVGQYSLECAETQEHRAINHFGPEDTHVLF
ncbi:MAG: caspase family protein [Pseudoxanthomonas sp.]|nr:MAG: caspase family protein [Pseudoxanthomonas sp.]